MTAKAAIEARKMSALEGMKLLGVEPPTPGYGGDTISVLVAQKKLRVKRVTARLRDDHVSYRGGKLTDAEAIYMHGSLAYVVFYPQSSPQA